MPAGQPKPAFYVIVGVVVVALIGFAIWRSDIFAPRAKNTNKEIDIALEKEPPDNRPSDPKEPDYLPAQRLPEVKGIAKYTEMNDRTVRFALNVWAGWAPIILANDGFKAGKVWKDADGKDFKVELELIDDPVQMRDAYAAGSVHIGWATVDMLPLLMESFVDKSGKPRDTRIMPRVYQQIDWSNGGDGIVVRDNIKTIADLRDKRIVLTQNSPSHFFILNMLAYSGVQPSQVQMDYTATPFLAADAFNAPQSKAKFAGCVSWAPNIYDMAKIPGNRLLVTTSEANKLIADVWFARADFAKDHPAILEGLVRGIFDAMVELKSEAARKKVAGLMAKGYTIPEADALGMLGDAHSTNWAENYQFLMNQNNPANFEAIWDRAYYLYSRTRPAGVTHQKVAADQVVDFSIIKKLGKEEKYASQKDEYTSKFVQKSGTEIKGIEKEILTNTVHIKFYSNSWDLRKKVYKKIDGKDVEELYEPSVDLILDDIAKLASQLSAAYIIIEGHTDSSNKGQVPPNLVKELSLNRANAVKDELLKKYPSLDAKRFTAEGAGWDRPADPSDPNNQMKNRRVEIKIYTAEKQ